MTTNPLTSAAPGADAELCALKADLARARTLLLGAQGTIEVLHLVGADQHLPGLASFAEEVDAFLAEK